MKKVLITGMSGLIGGLLRDHLDSVGGYKLTALNRRPIDGVNSFQGDIANLDDIKLAFEGQEVVVHLSAQLPSATWEDIASANLIGLRNVYEAARLSGVKRVVFASSGDAARGVDRIPPFNSIVAGDYERVWPGWVKVNHNLVRPSSLYGATKVWGEALGRVYSDEHNLSVLCVRIGAVPEESRPQDIRQMSTFLSHHDVSTMLRACIDAPDDLMYDVFFAVSNNKWNYRDLEHAKHVLGWEPRDSADEIGLTHTKSPND